MNLSEQIRAFSSQTEVGHHRFLNAIATVIKEKLGECGVEVTVGGKTDAGPITMTLTGQQTFADEKQKEAAEKRVTEYLERLKNPHNLLEQLK